MSRNVYRSDWDCWLQLTVKLKTNTQFNKHHYMLTIMLGQTIFKHRVCSSRLLRHSKSNRCSQVHEPVNNFSLSEYLFLSRYYIRHVQHNINRVPQNNFIQPYGIMQVKPVTGSQIYSYDATSNNLHQCCRNNRWHCQKYILVDTRHK